MLKLTRANKNPPLKSRITMDNKTKQLIGFIASSVLAMGLLVFFAGRGGVATYPLSSDGQPIPITKEQMELSNISRSLAETLPSFLGVPVGDVAVVPSPSGWKAVVFGVEGEPRKKEIRASLDSFKKRHQHVGEIELVFDTPPSAM